MGKIAKINFAWPWGQTGSHLLAFNFLKLSGTLTAVSPSFSIIDFLFCWANWVYKWKEKDWMGVKLPGEGSVEGGGEI